MKITNVCSIFSWIVLSLILLNITFFFYFIHRPKSALSSSASLRQQQFQDQIDRLRIELDKEVDALKELKKESGVLANQIKNLKSAENSVHVHAHENRTFTNESYPSVIPILVIACNRPENIRRTLNKIFQFKPADLPSRSYPVIVSQDCAHGPTSDVIASYGNKVTLIKQPDQSMINVPFKQKHMQGYYRIARHFKWALDQVFVIKNYQLAIIVEDDLEISADFFDYFTNLGRIMAQDPTIWCVSAWNDNGVISLIDKSKPEVFYRTDFFPGLGWMIFQNVWLELRQQWPAAYWDDHLRKTVIRKNRVCIRPEISRTQTFGKVGVSNGLFYEKYLKFIQLNSNPLDYSKLNLSYLLKSNFDKDFHHRVYSASLVTVDKVVSAATDTVRVEYTSKADFIRIANFFGAMNDLKDGVPRAAYQGVVPLFKFNKRIYLAPPVSWKNYDTRW